MLYLEFLFLLLMLYIGSRYGGIGLGVVSGIGLVIEVFVFKMPPTSPPIRAEFERYTTASKRRGTDETKRL